MYQHSKFKDDKKDYLWILVQWLKVNIIIKQSQHTPLEAQTSSRAINVKEFQ